MSVDDPSTRYLVSRGAKRERAKEALDTASGAGRESISLSLSLFVPVLPFKRRKSIMLRTLDIFSMIVIVAQPCLAPRAWQPHYSARGATVAAVASIRLSSDLPRLRLPIASLIVAFHRGRQGHLFGERPETLSRDRPRGNWILGWNWIRGLVVVVRPIDRRLINIAMSCLFMDYTGEIRKILIRWLD